MTLLKKINNAIGLPSVDKILIKSFLVYFLLVFLFSTTLLLMEMLGWQTEAPGIICRSGFFRGESYHCSLSEFIILLGKESVSPFSLLVLFAYGLFFSPIGVGIIWFYYHRKSKKTAKTI